MDHITKGLMMKSCFFTGVCVVFTFVLVAGSHGNLLHAEEEFGMEYPSFSSLQQQIVNCTDEYGPLVHLKSLHRLWQSHPDFVPFLKTLVVDSKIASTRRQSLRYLIGERKKDPDVYSLTRNMILNDADNDNRSFTIEDFATIWADHAEVKEVLFEVSENDKYFEVNVKANRELAKRWPKDQQVIAFLKKQVMDGEYKFDPYVRTKALEAMIEFCRHDPSVYEFAKERAINSRVDIDRVILVNMLAEYWPEDPAVITLIQHMCLHDKAFYNREKHLMTLAKLRHGQPDLNAFLDQATQNYSDREVRHEAERILSSGGAYGTEEFLQLLKTARTDEDNFNRDMALGDIVQHWSNMPKFKEFLQERISQDPSEYIQNQALEFLAERWNAGSEAFKYYQQIANSHSTNYVGSTALRTLIVHWKDEPSVYEYLKYKARFGKTASDRTEAIHILLENWKGHDEGLSLLFEMLEDRDPSVRFYVCSTLTLDYKNDPRTLKTLQKVRDSDENARLRGEVKKLIDHFWRDTSSVQ